MKMHYPHSPGFTVVKVIAVLLVIGAVVLLGLWGFRSAQQSTQVTITGTWQNPASQIPAGQGSPYIYSVTRQAAGGAARPLQGREIAFRAVPATVTVTPSQEKTDVTGLVTLTVTPPADFCDTFQLYAKDVDSGQEDPPVVVKVSCE